jgi:hypothetical protein
MLLWGLRRGNIVVVMGVVRTKAGIVVGGVADGVVVALVGVGAS